MVGVPSGSFAPWLPRSSRAWLKIPNGRATSVASPWPAPTTKAGAAICRARSSIVVFPSPASATRNSTPPRPARASSNVASIAAIAASRSQTGCPNFAPRVMLLAVANGYRMLVRTAPARRLQVDAIGNEEQTVGAAAAIVDAVLPDDLVRLWIDDDHPVTKVVVERDVAITEGDCERWVVEHPRAEAGRITPDRLSLWGHDQDLSGSGVIDQEDVPVRQHLRIGWILNAWCPGRPVEGAVPADLANPGAQDLRDQDVAVRQRRVAVGQAEGLWRVVGAVAGPTKLGLDGFRVVIDEDHAAVANVRNPNVAVGPHVGVVRAIEKAPGRAVALGHAVLPVDPMACVIDQHDRVRLLLIDYDRFPVGGVEGVVGPAESLTGLQIARPWEFPDDLAVGRHLDHAVVGAVGDQQVGGHHAWGRSRRRGRRCRRDR